MDMDHHLLKRFLTNVRHQGILGWIAHRDEYKGSFVVRALEKFAQIYPCF